MRSQKGFTIIETLIVLAVTGFAVLSAMLLVSGQQNKVQFTQSIQGLQQSIQQTMNEVSTGYYTNPGNFRCEASGSGVTLSTGTAEQGTNTGCIFMGKALQFGVQAADSQEYLEHTIAGVLNNGGSLSAAKPTVVAPGQDTNNVVGMPNISNRKQLLYGVQAVSMNYVNGGTRQPIGAVAFMSGLGKYTGGQLQSGTQQVSLAPIVGSAPTGGSFTTDTGRVVDAINRNLDDATPLLNPDGGVEICFASAGTEQSGLMTLGSNGRSLSVKLDIKSTRNCT